MISTLTPEKEKEWKAFVENHPESTIFHTLKWREIMRSCGFETNYRITGNEHITGVLPLAKQKTFLRKINVSLPIFEAAGPLTTTPQALKELLNIPSPYLIRSYKKLPESIKYANTYILKTDNFETVWDKTWKNKTEVRTRIRKSERAGITVCPAKTISEEIILKKHKRLGTPRLPTELWNKILEIPESYASVSKYNGKTIATMLSVKHKRKASILFAAGNPEYRKIHTDEILYADHIKHWLAKECDTIDFGRSMPGSNTAKFKERMGGKPQPLYAKAKRINPDYYSKTRILPCLSPIFRLINKSRLSPMIRMRIP